MIHLHAVTQPRQNAVLVPMTPDEHALEIGRTILGAHHKSGDLWAQEKTLAAIKAYFERLAHLIERGSRTTEDDAKAEFFALIATDLDEDGIPGLHAFLDDQREAGSAADRYWQGQDVARKLKQDDEVLVL